MDALLRFVVPNLPPDLQELVLNPPSLSRPTSFLPLIRSVFPYARWIVLALAVFIVWSAMSSVFGYFSRFLRLALRIGPILGFIAWVMAASGQGTMSELVQSVQQWVGLANNGGGGGMAPGLASLANIFGAGGGQADTRRATKGSGGLFGNTDPVSARTRNKKKGTAKASGGDDFVANIINSAAGLVGEGGGQDWQAGVQDYVKQAMAKASGLDWLFGGVQQDEERETRGSSRSR